MENGTDSIGTIISNSVLLEGSNASGPTTVNGSISLTEMSPLGAMAIEFSGTNQMNFRNSNPLGANPGDMAEVSYNFDAPIDLTITWGSGQFDEEEDYTLTFDPSITPVIVNPVADIIINQSPGVITYQTDVVVSAAVARTMTITLPGTTYFNINRTDSDGGSDRGGITLSTQVYCETDTDGDGAPDHLDLDSDNDGCPDALEGDGGFTFDQIMDDTLTGGVDTDGVPNVTSGGQDIGESNNPAIAACDCPFASGIDTDGDGIDDNCDLDDDNDGILDVNECYGNTIPTGPYLASEVTFHTTNNGATNPALLDSLVIGGVAYMNFVWPSSYTTNQTTTAIEQLYERNNGAPTGVDIHTSSTYETDILYAFQNNNLRNYQSWDQQAVAGVSFYQICYNTPISTSDAPLLMFQERNGNNIYEVEVFDPQGNLLNPGGNRVDIVPADYISTGINVDFNQPAMLVILPVTDFAPYGSLISCIKIYSGNTGDAGDGKVYTVFPNSNNLVCNDSDNDGILDYLDLDSDNDGCPDALEGDGGFTFDQIMNDTLTGGVDTLGIPVLATNSGQGIGTAADSILTGAACLTMAENDINQTPQYTPVSGNILINDTDPTGDNQTVQSATFLNAAGMETNLPLATATDIYDEAGTLAGSITLNTDGTYDFTPATDYTGEIPIEYVVVDDNGSTDTATLNIEVIPTPSTDGSNNDVIAQDDTNTTEQGETVTTPLLANDSDPDADPLSVTTASGLDPTGSPVALTTTPQDIYDENGVLAGQASLDANGNLIFTADNDFIGDVPVNYTATDGTNTDDATLVITVEPSNPDNDTYANDDASTGLQDEDQTGNILTNDNDPEAEPQSISSILVDTNGDGTATPVTPVAGTPTDIYEDIDGDGTPELIGTIDVDPATGAFTFNPEPDFVGTADIPYTVTDGMDSDDATLYVTVLPNENTTVAENDINQTPQNTPVAGNVLTNDTDEEDDSQTVQSATFLNAAGVETNLPLGTATDIYDEAGTLAGSITLNANGTYDFIPETGYTGEVPVAYIAVDDNGNPATDTATLSIEVMPTDDPAQNDPPVANDDTNTTEMDTDVAGNVIDPNDSDPEGDALTVTSALVDTDGDGIVDEPLTLSLPTPIYGSDENGNTVLAGTITLHASGTYSFDPATTFTGDVPIDYTISDGNGGTDDANLTISVEPNTGNNTYANDDSNSGDQGVDQSGNLLTNDNDPEGDDQDVQSILVDTDGDGIPEVVTPMAGTPIDVYQDGVLIGNITISPTTGAYNWNPEDDFVGTAVIPYTTTNGTDTDTATLYLTTFPVNTIASEDDFNNTPFETPVSSDVSTNDVDQEGDNQTFTLDGANGGMDPADGSVTLNQNGSYTYTPANGFSGETSFEYSTCDDGTPALCDTSTVFLEVFPQVNPETPQIFANPDANTVESGQTGTGNVMSNDLDPDALDPTVTTTLTAQTVPGVDEDGNPVTDAGTLTLNEDGSYSFTPTGNFTGTVTQPYTICNADAPAICDDTELIIEVLPDTGNTTFANDDAAVTDAGVAVIDNIATNDTDSEMDTQAITDFLVDTDGDGKGDTPGTVGTPTMLGGTNDMGVFVANAGEITLNGDGSYSFTPAPGFVGNLNIPYTTCDDNAMNMACEDATLVVTVLDVKRDYGDGPVIYPAVWHRAVTDSDEDNVLDGTTDVWLGMNTSFEIAQLFDPTSSADQYDDAISFGSGAGQFPLIAEAGTTYNVNLTVNSAQADLVFYGMWIDWDEDGVYDDFHTGSQVTASPSIAIVTITAPASVGNSVNIRLRADDDPFVATDFEGGKTNGEVEDFQALVVLPVKLTHFSGQPSECNVHLKWHAEMEENFSQYEIQRSGDGRLFSTIETVKGSGNNSSDIWYKNTDKAASKFNYY